MMGMLKWSCHQKQKNKGRGAIASNAPPTESPTPMSAPSPGISPSLFLLASPKVMHSLISCNAHVEKLREESKQDGNYQFQYWCQSVRTCCRTNGNLSVTGSAAMHNDNNSW
eukprot:2353409-Ditylum_brightwellii.AAC.1